MNKEKEELAVAVRCPVSVRNWASESKKRRIFHGEKSTVEVRRIIVGIDASGHSKALYLDNEELLLVTELLI